MPTRPRPALIVPIFVLLLSGGASSLMACPAEGLSTDAVGRTADLLMAAGAEIDELKIDRVLRGAARQSPPRSGGGPDAMSPEAQWAALGRITCPTLVVRGAASDILSQDTAEKMVDEVLADARLAVVPQAGHSVMTDNPDGFEEALSGFLLSEG